MRFGTTRFCVLGALLALLLPSVSLGQVTSSADGRWDTRGVAPTGFPQRIESFSDPSSVSGSSPVYIDDGHLVSTQAQFSAMRGSLSAKAYARYLGSPVVAPAQAQMATQANFFDAVRITSSTLPVGESVVLRVGMNFEARIDDDNTSSSQGFSHLEYNVSSEGVLVSGILATGTPNAPTSSSHLLTWVTFDYHTHVGALVAIQNGLLSDVFVGGGLDPLSAAAEATHYTALAIMTPGASYESVSGASYSSLPTGLTPQAITFGPMPSIVVGATGLVTAIGGGSGNPVTLTTLTPNVCSLSGNVVTALAIGPCTIAGDQSGNASFDPAPRATLAIAIVPAGPWASLNPMATARSAPVVAEIGGKLYVAGGCCALHVYPFTRYNAHEVYDPGTNSWVSAAPMTTAVESAPSAVIGGKLYVAGGGADQIVAGAGLEASSQLQVYDPAANTWTTRAPMPFASFAGFSGVIGGRLYVAGGRGPQSAVIGSLRIYDPSTDTWSSGAPMPTPRTEGASAVVNGILYTIGGFDGGKGVNTVEAYDPATNAWRTLAPMPTARWYLGAGVVDGSIYAAGGLSSGIDVSVLEVYDPVQDSWSTAPAMPSLLHAPGMASIGRTLYVIGGFSNNGETNTVLAYTPAPGRTPAGTGVDVSIATTLPSGVGTMVDIRFDNVVTAGVTTITTSSTGPSTPAGYLLGVPPVYYDVTTDATFTGRLTVCLGWSDGQFTDPRAIALFHYENGAWVDITTRLDTVNRFVCGRASSLSPFAIMERLPQVHPVVALGAPPTATYATSFTVTPSTQASTAATVTVDPASANVCSIAGRVVTMTSGTGTCRLMASWPADGSYTAASASQSIVARPAAARIQYTGFSSLATLGPKSSTANVLSSATVNVDAGDVTTAFVTFRNDSYPAGIPGCTHLRARPIDAHAATAICEWQAAGSTTVAAILDGSNYVSAPSAVRLVVAAPAKGQGITGSGSIATHASAGAYAGSDAMIALEAKFSKGSSNELQGSVAIAVRSAAVVYLFDATEVRSMSLPGGGLAGVTGVAVLATWNVTTPSAITPVGQGFRFQLRALDAGERGVAHDTVALTVWDSSGGLVLSTRWNGLRTDDELLVNGNLSVK